MKSLRILLGDRVSGGVLAALAGWFLVVQLFVAAVTCGMTVEAGASFVLCLPSQTVAAADASPAEDGSAFSHDCPSVIGTDHDGLLAAERAPGADLGPAYEPAQPVVYGAPAASADPIDPGRLGLAPAPRGPPLLSA